MAYQPFCPNASTMLSPQQIQSCQMMQAYKNSETSSCSITSSIKKRPKEDKFDAKTKRETSKVRKTRRSTAKESREAK
jgi:hypothetical protein